MRSCLMGKSRARMGLCDVSNKARLVAAGTGERLCNQVRLHNLGRNTFRRRTLGIIQPLTVPNTSGRTSCLFAKFDYSLSLSLSSKSICFGFCDSVLQLRSYSHAALM